MPQGKESLISVVMSTQAEVNLPAPAGAPGSMLSFAIESVVSQSHPEWELWIVGGHSEDHQVGDATAELVSSFHDQRIHYQNLSRQNGAANSEVEFKRRGAQLSHGDLLAFLDPGNAFEREHFRRCVDAFDDGRAALDLVYCDSRILFTGEANSKDLLQKAVELPYHFLGALYGEKFSMDLKEQLSPPLPIAPFAGMPYILRKPAWDAEARKSLERHCFIELSDAVMTRSAYDAAGGICDLPPLDWRLWRHMIRARRGRFVHLPHVGVSYTTADLTQHRQHYALGVMAKLNLPFDFNSHRGQLERHPKVAAAGIHSRSLPSRGGAPRVLFISEALAISHVARPSLLAAHLCGQGYRVCLARDPRYSNLISENGLEVADLKTLASSVVEERLTRQEPVHDAETLDRYVQEDLRVLRAFKPDIVVGDQRHSLAISSRLAKVAYINIADAHWSPAVDIQYELPNSPLSGILGMPLSNLIFQVIQPLAFAYQAIPLNVVRMKYGLPGISPDIRVCNTYGDFTVYPNDPELFTLKQQLPPKQMFIGPILWSPTVEKPEWWDRIPEDRPIVYVSLGSTGRPDLLSALFNVLERLPLTAVVATAGRWKPEPIPGNVFAADFLPGSETAARSRLVICNGGTMSGQQALSAGTPYLGLISNLDQMMFSTVVRKASACELLREGDVNEMTLRPMILNMLAQEKYQTAAKRLAARTENPKSCEKFEAVVCSMLREQAAGNFTHRTQAVG